MLRVLRYDDLLLNVMSLVLMFACILAPLAFLFTRIYMMHHTYNELISERENDAWLVQQCRHDEFYHNMKHHSSLCDDLTTRRRDSILMTSVQRVIEESYLCGFAPCTETLDAATQWVFGRGLVATGCCVLIMLTMPSFILPCLRRRVNVLADARLRSLHHAPYGHDNYVETALQRNLHPWSAPRSTSAMADW
jgi:hypothetical protein